MLSAYIDSFTSILLIQIPFISCLIVVARTSDTVLTRSGESGHPLVPYFNGKAFSSSPLYWLCFVISIEICSFYIYFLQELLSWMDIEFYLMLFLCHMILVLSFDDVVYHINWFAYTNHPCDPEMNPTWSWWPTWSSFVCVVGFSLLILSWRVLRLYPSKILSCNSFLVMSLSGFGIRVIVS